jgi:2-dehydropantoate 2-reductase
MRVAVLGPGGVGGLVAGALDRAGADVSIVAQESTVAIIAEHGVRVKSVLLGDFVAHPRALARLEEPVDALIVATKAAGLVPALERILVDPPLVLPLLNGLDHLAVLRDRFPGAVLAGTIRVEADRPEAGVIVQTSPFLRIDMATADAALQPAVTRLCELLVAAGVPARMCTSEAQVMWSKLVRLNALACTTSAHDKLLGEIRSTPELRAELVGAIEEGSAVARAEGAEEIEAGTAIGELEQAHATLGSSMQRDIAAGRAPELDAIPGSVLRAGARHGIACPTIEGLVRKIAVRIDVEPPIPHVD